MREASRAHRDQLLSGRPSLLSSLTVNMEHKQFYTKQAQKARPEGKPHMKKTHNKKAKDQARETTRTVRRVTKMASKQKKTAV